MYMQDNLVRDLISKLIVLDPAKRIGVDEAMGHAWIRKHRKPLRNMYDKILAKSNDVTKKNEL